jgi:hypothetical protein
MFENFYLQEKEVEVEGEKITLKKLTIADRQVVAPVVRVVLEAAQKSIIQELKTKVEEPKEEPKEDFDISKFDPDDEIEKQNKWQKIVSYLLLKGIKDITQENVSHIIKNVDPVFLEKVLVQIILFNYVEFPEFSPETKKPVNKKKLSNKLSTI